MDKDNGGFAFPLMVADSVMEGQYQPGMTLRDHFAAQALLGLLASGTTIHGQTKITPDIVAPLAYAHADAMLAERSK